MSKFKFGDRVNVASTHCGNASGVGVVISSIDDLNNIQFENGGYRGLVYDEFITLATDWVKCNERMPELYQQVVVYDGDRMWVDTTYDFGDGLCFYDGIATHWMPLPAPPQD